MKHSWILAALLSLPLLANDTAPTDALTCPDERLEQNVADLKADAEKGDAYSQRQLYLRYAL